MDTYGGSSVPSMLQADVGFEPLALHCCGQVLQIHIMVEFAERGLQAVSEALRLAMDCQFPAPGG